MTNLKDFKILNLDSTTANIYKNCFDSNDSPKDSEIIKWQFLEKKQQETLVEIAFDEHKDKAAAIYATFYVKFQINNKICSAIQSLDTITDAEYRGKGLFISLAKNVYKVAQDKGFVLVYGFPNGNSIHGFEKKLGWFTLDPVPFLLKPLKTKYFTNKLKWLRFLPNINIWSRNYKDDANYILKEEDNFPSEVELIWKKFSKNIPVSLYRDKAYLDWRYVDKPKEDYKIIHCYDNKNSYLGFIVFCIKEKHEGKIGYIMELVFDTSFPKSGKQLLSFAIDRIKKQNADCILCWCFRHSPNFTTFKRKSFFSLPEKVRPIELHFGARGFSDETITVIKERQNWYISYSDSDTV
jgi:Acetyltransferase (GNAT) domain